MTTIYLVRHGAIPQSEPRRFIGRQDLPLTEQGRLQMFCLAAYLADKGITRVVTSPLRRCLESCDILMTRLRCGAARVVADLQEISLGAWEGLTQAEVSACFPGEYAARGRDPLEFRPSQGESFADLAGRVWPAFEMVTATCSDCHLCVVAHAGVNRIILRQILGLPPDQLFHLQQDYGCVNILTHDKDGYSVARQNFRP